MARVIVSNLESEFERLKKVGKTYEVTTGGKEVINQALGIDDTHRENSPRVVRGSLGGINAVGVVTPYYKPEIQRLTLEKPTSYSDKVKWRRYFYQNEPIVGSACELHAQFPLSTFHLIHEDSNLRQLFEDMCVDLELFEFLLEFLLEYWVNGEVTAFGFFDDDKNPSIWTGFILLDPLYVDVKWNPLTRGKREELIALKPSEIVKKIVDNGPNHEETGKLYVELPSDVIESVKTNKPIILNTVQVSRVKRIGDYFEERGISIIDRCMKWLMYRDKLREAQYAVADRHITPTEFYLIGESGAPATQKEIDDFANILQVQWSQPNKAIVYHHALKVQWEGASGRVLPLQPEFEYIDKQLFIALLLNEGIVTAERQPYAATSVALDVMIQRYLIVREKVAKWVEKRVFEPLCRIHKIYKRTSVELNYGLRFNSSEMRPDIPKVKWDKESLRDDLNKINLLVELADKGWIPRDLILPLLGIDSNVAKKGLMQQKKEEKELGLPTTGVPPVGGGLGGPPPIVPEAPPEGEETPESEEMALPSEAVPPESHEVERGEGGLPGGLGE